MKFYSNIALASLVTISPAVAHSGKDTLNSGNKWYGARPDGHAPISVMGEHTHSAGEWMASYRYMNMQMNGLYMGDSKISFFLHCLHRKQGVPTATALALSFLLTVDATNLSKI